MNEKLKKVAAASLFLVGLGFSAIPACFAGREGCKSQWRQIVVYREDGTKVRYDLNEDGTLAIKPPMARRRMFDEDKGILVKGKEVVKEAPRKAVLVLPAGFPTIPAEAAESPASLQEDGEEALYEGADEDPFWDWDSDIERYDDFWTPLDEDGF